MESMFAHEVRAAARLNHPNVTTVFDHGILDSPSAAGNTSLIGCPWLAMEVVSGGTVRRLAGKTRWPEIRRILCDVLSALGHAHAKGMIHRDIKPGNILIDQTTGQVKLTDFGLAQSLSAMQNLPPRAEFMTGTPSYMAPEQIRGHRRTQGPWSDISLRRCTRLDPSHRSPTLLRVAGGGAVCTPQRRPSHVSARGRCPSRGRGVASANDADQPRASVLQRCRCGVGPHAASGYCRFERDLSTPGR